MHTLQDNPLWVFALSLYPKAQSALLKWQNEEGVQVNDLLWAAYGVHHHQRLERQLWRRLSGSPLRQLLHRVRQLRFSLTRDHPARPLALEWELMLEQMDLAALNDCIDPSQPFDADVFNDLAEKWGLHRERVEAKVMWLNSLLEEN